MEKRNKGLLVVFALLLFVGGAIWSVSSVVNNFKPTTENTEEPLRIFGLLIGAVVAYLIIKKNPTTKRIIIGSVVGVLLFAVCARLSNHFTIAFYFEIVIAVVSALGATALIVYYFISMEKDFKEEQKGKEALRKKLDEKKVNKTDENE